MAIQLAKQVIHPDLAIQLLIPILDDYSNAIQPDKFIQVLVCLLSFAVIMLLVDFIQFLY